MGNEGIRIRRVEVPADEVLTDSDALRRALEDKKYTFYDGGGSFPPLDSSPDDLVPFMEGITDVARAMKKATEAKAADANKFDD